MNSILYTYLLPGLALLIISTFLFLQSTPSNFNVTNLRYYRPDSTNVAIFGNSEVGDNLLLKVNRDINLDVEFILKNPGIFVVGEESPILLKHIKSKIVLPSGPERNLRKGWREGEQGAANGQVGQVPVILDYFKRKRDGFFIEAGAYDGQTISNTLLLEAEFGWQGLMIEPEPNNFKALLATNRQGQMMNACLSKARYPIEHPFNGGAMGGRVGQDSEANGVDARPKIQCYPFYSLMLASGFPRVDFISLDIEGDEYDVLKTIPWEDVDIESLLVEVAHTNDMGVRELMLSKGYKIERIFGDNQDIFFVKDRTGRKPVVNGTA